MTAITTIETHLRGKGIDANAWTSRDGSKRRVYINGWLDLAGIELTHYGTGNVAAAWIDGERVSNAAGRRAAGAIDKVWVDEDGSVHVKPGGRDDHGTVERVTTAIMAAMSALEVHA